MKKKQTIKTSLLKWPKKTVYLNELAGIIGWGKDEAYEDFYASVQHLAKEGLLTAVAGSGTNGMNPALENRYRVNLHNLPGIHELKGELLKLHLKLKIDYYQNHMDDYIKDRDIALTFNAFFSSGTLYNMIERRELAFMLFSEEKALDPSTHACKVLSRLGLNLQRDFNCFDRHLPVTYFPFSPRVQNVLIVENLTPFYDLFLILRKMKAEQSNLGKACPCSFKEHSQAFASQMPFDALALGNGNHIISAFEFFYDLFEQVKIIDFYYWGDVDGAGVNIYLSLKEKYPDFKISLWEDAYKAMLDANQWRADKSKLSEIASHDPDNCLASLLDTVWQSKAIPQEVIHFSKLEELIHGQ